MKKLVFLFVMIFTKLPATVYLEPSRHFKPSVEVASVYLEYKGQILLLHRQDNKSQGNKWGIPGGKIEKGETPLQAVIRETKEETGIDLSNQPVESLRTVYIEYDAKNHFVYHTFRTQLQSDPGAISINFNEHKGFTWVKPTDALKMDLLQDEDACIMKDYSISAATLH